MIKRIVIFFISLLVMILFAVYNSCYFPILLLTVGFVFIVIMFFLLFTFDNKLLVKADSIKCSYKKNQQIPIIITVNNLSNSSIGRADVTLNIKNKTGEVKQMVVSTSIMGKSYSKISFSIMSKYCGVISISVQNIKIYDYLCLFYRNTKINNLSLKLLDILVMPDLYKVNTDISYGEIEAGIENDMCANKVSGDDYSEVFDIREYRNGDKMQQIYWKLSAKYDDIMSKEYSVPIIENTIIFVELVMDKNINNPSKLISSEIETVYSISYSYICSDYIHYLCWFDYEKCYLNRYKVRTLDDLYYAIGEIMKCSVYSDKPYTIEYHNSIYNQINYSQIKYLSIKINNDVLEKLEEISKNQVQLISFICSKGLTDISKQDNNTSVSVNCMNLRISLENISF